MDKILKKALDCGFWDVASFDEDGKKAGISAYDPEISKQWYFYYPDDKRKRNVFISPKLLKKYGLDKEKILEKIAKYIPEEVFMTLQHIFVIYKQSDINYVNKYLDDWYGDDEGCIDMRNFGDLCDEGLVGKYFGYYDCIFINMRNIEKTTKELCPNDKRDFLDEMTAGFWVTLLHECMHLLDLNPIVDTKESETEYASKEDWAEMKARELYDKRTISDWEIF